MDCKRFVFFDYICNLNNESKTSAKNKKTYEGPENVYQRPVR